MHKPYPSHVDLQAAARQAMVQNGFQPDFPPQVEQQLAQVRTNPPHAASGSDIRDLRGLLWSSIDNDTSKHLDQIDCAERLPNEYAKVLVGSADVDIVVGKG